MKTLAIIFILPFFFGFTQTTLASDCGTDRDLILSQIENLVSNPDISEFMLVEQAGFTFTVDENNIAKVLNVKSDDYLMINHIENSVNQVKIETQPACVNQVFKVNMDLSGNQISGQ